MGLIFSSDVGRPLTPAEIDQNNQYLAGQITSQASTVISQAQAAATSAANSASAATTAATNATSAATTNAASILAGAQSSANSSASVANTAAASAQTYAVSASTAATNANTSLAAINKVWLGSLAVDPTVDLNGNPVAAGCAYFNTTTNQFKTYSASGWQSSLAPTDSGAVNFIQTGTGAISRTVQAKLSESFSILDYIPLSQQPAIKSGTSTYDCSAAFAAAFAQHKTVLVPQGTYCVTNIVIPDGCSLIGELEGNANAAASYLSIIQHIATSLSDVITCNSSSLSAYRSGGVISNIGVLAGSYSNCGINFTNPLGARCNNIYGAGYFQDSFISVLGALFFEISTLNYIYSGPFLTPAAIHFKSFNGNIIGTTSIIRRAYIHGNGSDNTQGIFNAFKFDPAASLQTIIELCGTESISGPVFEIGKGNIVWVNDHYIENVPNTDSATAPIFNVGVNGSGSSPNNTYDTSTALHLDGLWGLGNTTNSSPVKGKLVNADVAAEINLYKIKTTRVLTLISGTNNTQKTRVRDVHAPDLTTISSGLSAKKLDLLGGNIFSSTANAIDTISTGLWADKANIPAGGLVNGFLYWSRDRGANGSLEIYNKAANKWCQPLPSWNTAPTTGTWNRGDVVWNMYASAGSGIGWICIGAGTPGTWAQFGQAGVLTSISATPSFIGQLASVSGIGYMATGTSSTADWKQITN